MPKRRTLLIAVACVVVVAAIALFPRTSEPAYNGLPLSTWVAAFTEVGPGEKTFQKAMEAVDHIGTNATPFLLAWIQFEPPPGPFTSKFVNPYNWDGRPLSFRDRLLYDFRGKRERLAEGAETAFQVLGARATPAIPELTRLMNARTGPLMALRAALALARLGTNGLPPLLAAIDDPQHQNRFDALKALDMLPDPLKLPAERVVPHLIQCVSDQNDKRVAPTAVYALRKFGSEPRLVIPVLTNCLNSTDHRIRWWSATALGDIGRPAAAALPALTNALSDPDPSVRQQAGYAIEKIGPTPRSNAPAH